jgi:hypothetical protein
MSDAKQSWDAYKDAQLKAATPVLKGLGFVLDERQPHILGERFLMQAVTTTSGRKLILLGHQESGSKRVVIKVTSDDAGAQEILHDHECQRVLKDINFAYEAFVSPPQLLFTKKDGLTISVQEFIEQDQPFLERPLKEQFAFALKAFKAQESTHATTYRHLKLIQKTFETIDAQRYLHLFKSFNGDHRAYDLLKKEQETIERYGGFLTHTDFVPHNFKIRNGTMYLLDHSSIRFGNKYEGWARFLNFMTLYNPALEAALVQYVRDNRTPEELLSLRLMRIYRLGEIIWYYQNTLSKSSGDLYKLNEARVVFWKEVLEAMLHDEPLKEEVRTTYITTRDSLRSEDEKIRQQGLH